MGMYTQLHYGVYLSKDIPPKAVEILKLMCGYDKVDISPMTQLPDHLLFKTDRWDSMLRSNSGCFDYQHHCSFIYDIDLFQWNLSVTCSFKNYCDEVTHFIEWIRQFIDERRIGKVLGYYLYEEGENPVIIRY